MQSRQAVPPMAERKPIRHDHASGDGSHAPPDRKRCIFCDNAVGSAEHIWSKWMHPLLPKRQGPDDSHLRVHSKRGHENQVIWQSGPIDRQGDIRTVRVRVVCQKCNSGWMNELEMAVRPLITPIIIGTRTELSEQETIIFARWAAMKTMVCERDPKASPVIPREDAVDFARGGEIPAYIKIYSAPIIADVKLQMRSTTTFVCLGEEPDPPLGELEQNLASYSMIYGGLWIYTVISRITNFLFEDIFDYPLLFCRFISPSRNRSLVFNPSFSYSLQETEMVASLVGQIADIVSLGMMLERKREP